MTGEEFFSDAKDVVPVLTADGKDTGLVKTKALKQTAGGQKFDVGAGSEFAPPAEDAADAEETKWDQFWNFPGIENEHKFATIKEFKDYAFMPLLLAFKKHGVAKGIAKDKDDLKAKGQLVATAAFKWVQEHFKDIEFYSLETTSITGSDFGDEFKDDTYAPNYVRTCVAHNAPRTPCPVSRRDAERVHCKGGVGSVGFFGCSVNDRVLPVCEVAVLSLSCSDMDGETRAQYCAAGDSSRVPDNLIPRAPPPLLFMALRLHQRRESEPVLARADLFRPHPHCD